MHVIKIRHDATMGSSNVTNAYVVYIAPGRAYGSALFGSGGGLAVPSEVPCRLESKDPIWDRAARLEELPARHRMRFFSSIVVGGTERVRGVHLAR